MDKGTMTEYIQVNFPLAAKPSDFIAGTKRHEKALKGTKRH